jgi:hypothetical protein
MNITMPLNVREIMGSFIKITDFKMPLDGEVLYDFLLDSIIVKPNITTSLLEPDDEEENLEEELKPIGSSKIVKASSPLFLGLLFVGIYNLALKAAKFFCWEEMPNCLNKFIMILTHLIMWSTVLRLCLETYLPTTAGTFRNAQQLHWDSGENVLNSLVTIIFVPAVLIFPFAVLFGLRENHLLAQTTEFRQRFGSLYMNVDYFNKDGLLWMAVSLLRQMSLAVAVVFLTNNSAY